MILVVFCFLALAGRCYGQTVGAEVEIALSVGGLNYAAGVAADILTKELLSKPLPDVAENPSFSNIRIVEFTKPTIAIQLNAGSGLTLKLNDIGVKAEADWRIDKRILFIRYRDSGSVTASAKASVSTSVSIGSSSDGKPIIHASPSPASLNDLNIKIHGSPVNFIYNLLINLFKNKIRTTLENLIRDKIVGVINEKGAQQLSTLTLKTKINQYLTIDYSLAKAPYFSSDFLKSYHKGTFVGDTATYKTPLMNTPTNKMIGFSISENVINSAVRVLYGAGQTNFTFTYPDWSKMSQVLPFLPDQDGGPFDLIIYATKVPTARMENGEILTNITAELDVISKTPGQPEKNLLSIKFRLAAKASASISSNVINGSLTNVINGSLSNITLTIDDITPPLKDVPLPDINAGLKGLFEVIKVNLNEALVNGLPLPKLKGVSFSDTTLVIANRYLSASANVKYDG